MALWPGLLARPGRVPLQSRPSLTLYFLVAGAFLLTLVPHVVDFPYWLTLSLIAAMVLRSVVETYRLPLPTLRVTTAVALVLPVFIFLQYGHFMGRDSGTAMTAGLLAIKFFELRGPRDVTLIIFSCFFMVMSALLYSQIIENFIYCLIMMWVLTALLMRVYTGDLSEDRLLRMLMRSGLIFIQALPLALFLFFFFPRYNGPIGIPLEDAAVGLTDTVTPGSIAKLSQNDSDAMYVQFEPGSSIPTTDSMYWRAMVLWRYSGGAWTPGDVAEETSNMYRPETKAKPGQVLQTITIKPHHRRWLFALDVPVSLPVNSAESPSWATATSSHVVELNFIPGKLEHIARYSVISSLTPPEEYLTAIEEQRAGDLPDEPGDKNIPQDRIDPEVRALADQLHAGISGDDVDRYVDAVIHFFRHGGFTYSTEPGIQGPNWLHHFLFNNVTGKTGFCEHYASAFAVLMRLEKVKARVVVGYLGADYNPYQDIYTVSQSMAHAWDEVWIADPDGTPGSRRGHWKRIDPTALIMAREPVRLANTAGGNEANDKAYVQMAPQTSSIIGNRLPDWVKNALKEVKLRREQVEINWDNLVLSYNPETQSRLAQALGFGDKADVGLLTACLAAAAVCLMIFRQWFARVPSISPVEKLYATFCSFMARRGHPRAAWEGPLAFTNRVAEAFPQSKPAIHRVGSIVAHARYGPSPVDPSAPDDLQSLLTLIAASNVASSSRDRP